MPSLSIDTRFHIPSGRERSVTRDALIARVRQGLQGRLTLISAPPGYGKSTLAADAVRDTALEVAWLSLSASENDLHGFIAAVCDTLTRSDSGIGEATGALLQSARPPDPDSLLVNLLNELATCSHPLVIVLDDYHLLDSPAIDDALAFLLEHLPHAVHLLLVSREDPALPLGRLRAQGDLVELRQADLRFDASDTQRFLAETMGLSLSPEQAARLEARTEGWIAGLQLAAVSLQNLQDAETFIERFTGSHRFVIDYLAEEVLASLPGDERDFLLCTSILDRFDASLCNAVTGNDDAERVLARLDRRNLFLIPLDDRQSWYRYHHLFADVLRSHLARTDIAPADLHKRAADCLDDNALPIEAIHHSLAAGDVAAAAARIQRHWPALRRSNPESVFTAWMAELPDTIIDTSASLSAYLGMAELSYDMPAGAARLEHASALLQASGTETDAAAGASAQSELAGLIELGRGYCAGARGQLDAVTTHTRRAISLLDDDDAVWRGAAAVLAGVVHWSTGQLASAAEAMQQGTAEMARGGDLSGELTTLFLLANIRIAQGSRRDAERICRKALTRFERHALPPQGSADLLVTLATLAFGRCHFDEARRWLADADALGQQAVLLESAHHTFRLRAQLAAAAGHFEQADDMLAEARECHIPSPAPEFSTLDGWQARIDLLAGDMASALRWAGELHTETLPQGVDRRFSALTRIRIGLVAGDTAMPIETALSQLGILESECASGENIGDLMEIRILKAFAQHRQGDTAGAMTTLSAALDSPDAERQAIRLVFEPKPLRSWLHRSIPQLAAPDWALQTLEAHQPAGQHVPATPAPASPAPATRPAADSDSGTPSVPNAAVAPLIEPLSSRERDVLRLLHSELSGPDIAARMFVSLNTLRTHTRNIYAKLGVNSRRSAIRRASELGLN